jgi:hypothetical protein
MTVEVVMLTEADMERAARVAYLRNTAKAHSPNYRVDTKTADYDMHFAGVRAELAVCKMFSFPLDERYGPDGDNGRPDLYVGDLRVEVKAAFYRPPVLKLNTVSEFTSDAVVMCYVPRTNDRAASVIEIWGCVSRLKFIAEHTIRDFGQGPRAAFERFAPISALRTKAQERAA